MRHALRNAVTALLLAHALSLFGATPSQAQSGADAFPDSYAWNYGDSRYDERWTGSDGARQRGCATDGRGYSARLEDEESDARGLEGPFDDPSDQTVEVWTDRRPDN